MNRSVLRERLATTTQVLPGEVVVAHQVEHPTRGPVRCAAASLVSGALRRRGIPVRYDEFNAPGPGERDSMLDVTSWLDQEGQAVGFGAAAHHDDSAATIAMSEVMREWSSVLRTRRMLLAAVPPVCSGAMRTTEMAGQILTAGDTAFVYGSMVAEQHTLEDLRRRGALSGTELARIPDGATLVFPAHGVSLAVRAEAVARGMSVVDATCPVVAWAHAEVRRFVRRGDEVVVIAHADHALVDALIGQAPESVHLVTTVADVHRVRISDPDRLSYLVAPGFPVAEAAPMIAALRARFPASRAQHPNGLCYAATDRAEAIASLGRACDLLLVAGASDCPDAASVADQARASGCPAVRVVACPDDIQPQWLAPAWCVGLTSSLSAAPHVVEQIATAVSGLGPLSVVRRAVDSYVTALGSLTGPGPRPALTIG